MSSLTFDEIRNAHKSTFMKYIKDGNLEKYRPIKPVMPNGFPGPIPLIRSVQHCIGQNLTDFLFNNRRWFQIMTYSQLFEEYKRFN
jgi:hypothetical protein